MKKKYHAVAAVLMINVLMTACGSSAGTGANVAVNTAVDGNTDNKSDTNVITDTDAANDVSAEISELFSNRDLSGEYDASKCENITLSDSGCTTDSKNVTIGKSGNTDTATITREGDYMISGSLSDGMLIVDVDKTEKVQLVLNGVNIKSSSSAAIYVRNADKVFVTLADGTENRLENGGDFTAIDDNNIDAVIFSKDDLTVNGTGKLIINSPAGHGIVSKNELTIAGGNYEITASSHGMTGKDSIVIADGMFRITSGEDAIKSDNNDDATKGRVYILGGNYLINSGDDGISALNEINISGGTLHVNAEGDGLDSNGHLVVSGGEIYIAGSVNNGDSALDYNIDAVISGGIVIAAGQGGMAQNFGGDSTQGAILINTGQTYAAGNEIALLDSTGKKLVSWTAEKSYNSVVISCPEIKDGETYTVKNGETDTSVTMDGLIYGQGGQMGGHRGAGGEKRGFKDGTRPERMPDGTKPAEPNGAKPEDMPKPL